MTIPRVESDQDRLGFFYDFGVQLTWDDNSIDCLFDKEFMDILVDDVANLTGNGGPTALIRTIDLLDLVKGSEVSIEAAGDFYIHDIDPNYDGFTVLELKK